MKTEIVAVAYQGSISPFLEFVKEGEESNRAVATASRTGVVLTLAYHDNSVILAVLPDTTTTTTH